MTEAEAVAAMEAWAAQNARRDDLIRQASGAGVNRRRIAQLMGISRTTVYTVLAPIADDRIAEIRAQLNDYTAAGGVRAFDDVIWALPEYARNDPRNIANDEEPVDEYWLTDGSLIDGEGDGWKIIRPQP